MEQLDGLYDPTAKQMQASVIRLSGLIKDLMYYDLRHPDVALPQMLTEHFRGKADMFVWYSLIEGLQYEFDHITPDTSDPTRPLPSVERSVAAPLDPGAAFQRAREARQASAGRRGGGKYANNAPDAIREIDELLRGHRNRHIVVLFHNVMWELTGQDAPELIPRIANWPGLCLGHHLVIFTAEPMPTWIQDIHGAGVQDLTIQGPTADEIKLRLIHEHLSTGDPFFDWQKLDEIATFFEAKARSLNTGYRWIVEHSIDKSNRGNRIYDADFLKQNLQTDALDYSQIDVQGFEQHLTAHIIGQTEAKRWAIKAVQRLQKHGVPKGRSKPKPLIRKLFAGPSGVGKTEIARVMSRFVFNRDPLIIPGTEYHLNHETAKLLGAPPGYVGHGQPGLLTRYLQEKPYGLIVLDEYEKGSEQFRRFFMNVLEEGITTTPVGIILNFGNTIVIATSNAGSEVDERPEYEHISAKEREQFYKAAIAQKYDQALLGRFSGYIVFDRLSDQDRLEIAHLYVNLFTSQAKREHDLPAFPVRATDAFYSQLLRRCPKSMGARKIQESINTIMEDVLDVYLDEPHHAVSLDWTGDFPTANGHEIEIHL